MEFIAKITIKHNGKTYGPGEIIELSKKEAEPLPVCTKKEWESVKSGAASGPENVLKEVVESLTKEREELKISFKAAINELETLKAELEAAKKELEAKDTVIEGLKKKGGK